MVTIYHSGKLGPLHHSKRPLKTHIRQAQRTEETAEALTEVGYLCVHVCVQQHVFRFQVPVDHHVPVAVIHAGEDLLEKTSTFLFIQLRKVERHLKGVSFKRNSSTYNSSRYKTVGMHEPFQMNLTWEILLKCTGGPCSLEQTRSDDPGTEPAAPPPASVPPCRTAPA